MDEAAFRRYIEHFNRREHDRYAAFYTDDMVITLPGQEPIEGGQAFAEFARALDEYIDEHVEIIWLVVTPDAIAAELDVTFDAIKDVPEFGLGPLTAGETLHIQSWAHYDLRDGKIARVRVVLAKRL